MTDKDCCTYECQQGRNCPVRSCRQRAGKPADYKRWQDFIEPTEEQIREWEQQDRSDMLGVIFLIGVVFMFILVVLIVGVGA